MHRNAPLTPEGRLRLCRLIDDGSTIAAAAESFRISRQTAHKWWRRYLEAGEAGLVDRSSRPRRCPAKTPAKVERRVVALRRRHQLGPARLASRAGVPASTLHAIWARHGVSRLSDLERRSGRTVRKIETSRPGELVHIDIKKQAKIPKGGGWKVHGRGKAPDRRKARGIGYAFVHSAIDAYSRLAYSEVHDNEQAVTNLAFWRRAKAFFESYGIADRASAHRQRQLLSGQRVRRRAGPGLHHPHLHQALPTSDQWQGGALQPHVAQRMGLRPALSLRGRSNPGPCPWLHMYNHHRHHTAIGGPPISRLNNVAGQNT